ncbi:hypothetical protein AGMMS49982_04210 [Bacteroidia bacterium]|nr:hypothetical protein AGMMS49982_04210 [Bacteroidia bacterium]
MMKYQNILEEEIKNKVAQNYFDKFDCTKILGKIDFAVKMKRKSSNLLSLEDFAGFNAEYLLWAEAKQKSTDIVAMLTQLVLTIGKARTFDEIMPPPFLGCYDNEKIAFVPYSEIQHIFYQNDFNWKITPSDHDTKEFKLVYAQIKKIIDNDIPWNTYLFDFVSDEKELKKFIRDNFVVNKGVNPLAINKLQIDKNNFIIIYNKWLQSVKPSIAVNWTAAKKAGIIDGDFYLADLLSSENASIKDNLFVLLHSNFYEIDRKISETGLFTSSRADFSDNQKAHNQFWARYQRPPHEEYWDYIVNRRDLLVPQDVRERKGSFFTPQIWVELSQRYLADVLGKDWQDEYYVWDCAAGTGNLLAGLTNKYKIWASTLDKADVDAMHDRIDNGANLLHDHVFQFDFLNDEFLPQSKGGKLPDTLFDIIESEKRRKNLLVYINPPYAEGNSNKENKSRSKIHLTNIYAKYKKQLDKVGIELFAQFLVRIYFEISNCKIGQFSTLKVVSGSNSTVFRNCFLAKLEKVFMCQADTFDNVPGQFPIGFFIWNTEKKDKFIDKTADIYNRSGLFIQTKKIFSYDNVKGRINDWLRKYKDKNDNIGILVADAPDFQNNNYITIQNNKGTSHKIYFPVTINNLIEVCVYFAVRKVIPATWLNDRDQFIYPNKKWEADTEFHNDCLTYTIFNNNISSNSGVNHWIPFSETEVNARTTYASHTLITFLSGKITKNGYADLFDPDYLLDAKNKKTAKMNWKKGEKREFSPAATAVFDAGRELWRYYHGIAGQARNDREGLYNVNASLYDIREYFQERNDKGKMNNTSTDTQYTELIGNLRKKLNALAQKIEPKVYEYGFLKA